MSTKHHFIIEPFRGIGPIRFGMHKDEVSHAFTYVYSSFFKSSTSMVRADDCEAVGLIIHYNSQSRVNLIESYKPRYSVVTLDLFDRDISGISVRDLVAFLSSNSYAHTRNAYGYEFPELGIHTYNNHLESDEQPVELFGLESKNYRECD